MNPKYSRTSARLHYVSVRARAAAATASAMPTARRQASSHTQAGKMRTPRYAHMCSHP